MKLFLVASFSCFLIVKTQHTLAQASSIDRVQFFRDTAVVNATVISNMNKLFKREKKGFVIPARFVTTLPDGTKVDDEIQLEVRGNMRHDYCYVPPLKVIFKYRKASVLASLKSLKLVNACRLTPEYDQYLLKEYMVYKIYNLITDISFRVRLLNVTFIDSAGRRKPIAEHGFLMEDIKEVAKRNSCRESALKKLRTEETDRRQMTCVALFEYMIGNTDWAVPANHNIKLITPSIDSDSSQALYSPPYVVPYDFDYSGLVNTEYAVPPENIQIENVRERAYRGYPRTMKELNEALDIFKQKKEEIYLMVRSFHLLNSASKEYLIDYLDSFYKIISKPVDIESIFINGARK